MPENKVRILLVDDHPLVRRALADLISEEQDLEVCGEASSVAAALENMFDNPADLAVVDISLEGTSGLELVKAMRQQHPTVPVIVFSMHDEKVYAERCIRAGARGYVMKRESTRRIIAAIRDAISGRVAISPDMAQLFSRKFARAQVPPDTSPLDCLSDRELEIFQLLGSGCDTRMAADRLHINVKTVQTYCARIKEKLGLDSATELLVEAVRWKESTRSEP
jgi:DNA-binding NarL/FixJ family response regulator